MLVPIEDAQRPLRVPPAGLPVAVLELELSRSGVGVLEQPGAMVALLVADKVYRVVDPLVGGLVNTTEVVEGAQDVVVPARWPGELEPTLGRDLTGGSCV